MPDERRQHLLDYEKRRTSRGPAPSAALLWTALGVFPLAVGLRWLQVFIFSDYRAHFRHIMIPLGVVATTLGLLLVVLPWVLRAGRRRE